MACCHNATSIGKDRNDGDATQAAVAAVTELHAAKSLSLCVEKSERERAQHSNHTQQHITYTCSRTRQPSNQKASQMQRKTPRMKTPRPTVAGRGPAVATHGTAAPTSTTTSQSRTVDVAQNVGGAI